MPATFSAIGAAGAAVVPEVPVDPGEAAEGASGAAACPAALPHFGQNAALSAICVPQAEQNAMKTSSSYPRRTITELDGERKWNSEHLLRIARMLDSSPRGCPPSAGQRVSFSEWRRANSERRFLCPAALLVLLAAAAWARIVAADFVAADHLLHRALVAAAGHTCLLQFAPFASLESLLHVVHRSCRTVAPGTGTECRHRIAIAAPGSERRLGRRVWRFDHLHQVQVADCFLLEALHHGLEHVERFALVLHQRIMLTVAAQPDALSQVVHAEQVVFPLLVNDAEHDDALVMAHRVGPNQLLFRVVALFQLVEDGVAQFLTVQLLGFDAFGADVDSEAGEDLILQALDVPIFGMGFLISVFVEQAAENVANVVFEDEFLLVDAFQQLPAQSVDCLALLVHYVVVLKQMFAGLEVLRLNRFLCRLDAPCDHPRLDRNALFHSQPLKQVRHPLFGEDTHQVIFQRQIEPRGSRIALASGAPTQLVVNAPRLVAFGAEDE